MRMLIATDGLLTVEPTVKHVERHYREGDTVIVMTVVNLPRRLLTQLEAVAASGGAKIDEVVEAAGPAFLGLAGADRVAERLAGPNGQEAVFEDFVTRYLAEVVSLATRPMVEGLSAAGIKADTLARESENETASTIMNTCRERDIDLLVIGSTGRGRFEGLVGSTGTKLLRHAPCDVLLIRVAPE
jgi:nucleotide-binding universal stress UspA family protein